MAFKLVEEDIGDLPHLNHTIKLGKYLTLDVDIDSNGDIVTTAYWIQMDTIPRAYGYKYLW